MCVWRVGVITGGGGDVCVWVGVITDGGGDVCVGRGDHCWWWGCVYGG